MPMGTLTIMPMGTRCEELGRPAGGRGLPFCPWQTAVESFGGWHEVAEREVRKLGAALAHHTGQEESEAIGSNSINSSCVILLSL